MTCDELYKEFCEWSPEHATMVTNYRPWGSHAIVIWLSNGMMYKVKRCDVNRFIMQKVSQEDINKKFGLNK